MARPGGGYSVSWFDNRAGGYDGYLQLLDEAGVEQWPHDGVLVADRSFRSTQDDGLGVDTAGDTLLAFRDDRFAGTQITAAKVDSTGTLAFRTSDSVAGSVHVSRNTREQGETETMSRTIVTAAGHAPRRRTKADPPGIRDRISLTWVADLSTLHASERRLVHGASAAPFVS